MAGYTFKKELLITSDGPSVRFSCVVARHEWVITANKYGVIVGESPTISNQADLQSFARAMAVAYKEYHSIRYEGKPTSHSEVPVEGQDGDAVDSSL